MIEDKRPEDTGEIASFWAAISNIVNAAPSSRQHSLINRKSNPWKAGLVESFSRNLLWQGLGWGRI